MKLISKKILTIAFSSFFLSIPGLTATVHEQAFIIGILASEKCQVRKGENKTLLREMIKNEVHDFSLDMLGFMA